MWRRGGETGKQGDREKEKEREASCEPMRVKRGCTSRGGGRHTTMHLIINSLDTRRWMSDGVSSRGVEERGGGGRGEGNARGLLQKWRSDGEWRRGRGRVEERRDE